jgi:hypothetical protein
MVRSTPRLTAALIFLLAGMAACVSTPPPETAPTPQPDSLRNRESGSQGYVIPPRLDPRKHGPRRFYTAKDYGSEAQFNPLTEFLNEGFDVFSLEHADRHVLTRTYGVDAHNVFRSVMHPVQSLSDYGWDNVLRAEILPTSLTRSRTSGKWVSNYQLHMFGSGMVSLRMTDWYELHGYDHAALLGQATTMAAHFLNEMNENGGSTSLNEDPVVDIMIFDVAGFVLWHQHWMQRAFSGSYHLTNWPGQPSYDPVNRTLENTGQYFVLRGPLPVLKTWDFFYVMGMSGSVGVSKTIGGGRALSLGMGFDGVPAVPATDSTLGSAATTLPKATLYFDRNGSLMWSVAVGNRTDATRLKLDVYPGVFRVHGFTTGAWMQVPRAGGFKAGIISTLGVGMGGASRRAKP